MKPFVYLASQSSRRREILKKMGFQIQIIPSAYKERPKKTAPAQLVLDHAKGKLKKAILPKNASGKVLGADTIVYCRGRVLGKPKNLKQAAQMLNLLSGRRHTVYTGVAVSDLQNGKIQTAYEKTEVFMKKLSQKQIEEYFKKVPPLDKAGAYAIQMKPKIVTKIQGSYTNVVGLPKELIRKLLKKGNDV